MMQHLQDCVASFIDSVEHLFAETLYVGFVMFVAWKQLLRLGLFVLNRLRDMSDTTVPNDHGDGKQNVNSDEDNEEQEVDERDREAEVAQQLEDDRLFAESLQAKFENESKMEAEKLMFCSPKGKAWKFVDAVIQLHNSCEQYNLQQTSGVPTGVTTVAIDDLVFLVVRMLAKQKEFKSLSICSHVDIGFHWTRHENMKRIRTDGLLTFKERSKRQIHAKHNGSTYGDGVYTSDLHTSHKDFGPVCLLVARLKGATSNVVSDSTTYEQSPMVVLRSSAQVVPLIQFTTASDNLVHQYKSRLQALIDIFINAPIVPAGIGKKISLHGNMAGQSPATASPFNGAVGFFNNAAPVQAAPIQALAQVPIVTTIHYDAPHSLGDSARDFITTISAGAMSFSSSDCAICLNPLNATDVGQVKTCGHEFHLACVHNAIAHSSRCPLCNKNIVEPQGKMPSGDMVYRTWHNVSCTGFAHAGTIEINYSIPSGIQEEYHSSPGSHFLGAVRIAYLPDVSEGRFLLKRLVYAFEHGLTFTIGTSLSTGQLNVVTWASIHHKTSRSGGAHGFPDNSYFWNCNDELDALGVPRADML
ncbi:E3 ubiquitin-protein ligase dtx3l [Mayamaea pseudoterrestris]|nr:E3 ubiquitin-protein ligase dtx3l [Mayamaea pseudoterrestris]